MYGLGALAILIGIWAVGQFRYTRTTINPHKPEAVSELVTSGLYRYSRNPMYLGLLLLLLAWGLYLREWLPFLWAAAFVWYMNRFQIAPEEEVLEAKFADAFESYRKKVRRWI